MSQATFETPSTPASVTASPDFGAIRHLSRTRRPSPRFSMAGGIVLLVCTDAAAALMAPKLASALIVPAPSMASGPVNLLLYGGMTVLALLFCGFYGLGAARAPLDHAGRLLRGLLSAHVLVLLRIALVRPAPESLPLERGWDFAEWGLTPTDFERLHQAAILEHRMFRTMPVIEGAAEALWRPWDRGGWGRLLSTRADGNVCSSVHVVGPRVSTVPNRPRSMR